MLRLRPGADVGPIMEGLARVVARLDGCSGFVHGPNRDFEGKTGDFTHGFTLDARDGAALRAYAEDPEHRALGARLVACCDGGAQGIRVYDIDTSGA